MNATTFNDSKIIFLRDYNFLYFILESLRWLIASDKYASQSLDHRTEMSR